jgi:hypothetical protein
MASFVPDESAEAFGDRWGTATLPPSIVFAEEIELLGCSSRVMLRSLVWINQCISTRPNEDID